MPKCPKCEREYSERDFYGKEICFRCSYKRKTEENVHELQKSKCRICEKPVAKRKEFYCSEECSAKYQKSVKKWWQLLKKEEDGWKFHPLDIRNYNK